MLIMFPTPPPFHNQVCRYEVACTDMWEIEFCQCCELHDVTPPPGPLYRASHSVPSVRKCPLPLRHMQIPQHNFSPLCLHVWPGHSHKDTHPLHPHCTGPCWPRSIIIAILMCHDVDLFTIIVEWRFTLIRKHSTVRL